MVNIYAQIADKLLGVLEKFLDPQQYDIARLKKQDKALLWAEREFDLTGDILDWVTECNSSSSELKQFKKLHSKNKRYFEKHSGREV